MEKLSEPRVVMTKQEYLIYKLESMLEKLEG